MLVVPLVAVYPRKASFLTLLTMILFNGEFDYRWHHTHTHTHKDQKNPTFESKNPKKIKLNYINFINRYLRNYFGFLYFYTNKI